MVVRGRQVELCRIDVFYVKCLSVIVGSMARPAINFAERTIRTRASLSQLIRI